MPLKINVGTNEAARNIVNEMFRRPVNNNVQNDVAGQPVQQQAPAGQPADGLLTRTLKQVMRQVSLETGHSHADCLSDVVAGKSVNLRLDHSDEVDGGASMRAMDDDWVEVGYASELIRPEAAGQESAAAAASRTMAELEHMTTDDVREVCTELLRSAPAGLSLDEAKSWLERKLLDDDAQGIDGIAGENKNKIAAAVKAQLKLADELWGAAIEQENPDPELMEAGNRSMRCANALLDLVTKVGTLNGKTDNLLEELDRKLQLEGQDRRLATETVVRVFDAQLADFNRLYNSLSEEGHVVTADEFKRLDEGLAKARKMLKDAQDGVRITGQDLDVGLQNLDKDVLSRIEKKIGEMSGLVEQLKVESLKIASEEIYNQFSFDLLKSPLFDAKYAKHFLAKYCENMNAAQRTEMKKLVKDFREGLQNFKNALDKVLKTGQMDEAREAFLGLNRMLTGHDSNERMKSYVIKDYIEASQVDAGLQLDGQPLNVTSSHRLWALDKFNKMLPLVCESQGDVYIDRLSDMVRVVGGGKVPIVSGAMLSKVLDGSCGLATAVQAVAWGETSVETGIDDRYLVSSKPLGSGACNTVTLCFYRHPDGSTQCRVFKPEVPARASMEENRRGVYDSKQKVSAINVSVCQMAKVLGLDKIVVNAHAGVHDGKFGLMMNLADGMTAQSIGEAFKSGDLGKRIGQKTVGDVQTILDENGPAARKLLGNIRHALTDLDWFDHIVGQTDRNPGNYMISIGEDLSVELKGIDNDFSFSPSEEDVPDGRAYPPVVSKDVCDKLDELVAQMDERGDKAAIRQWLREEKNLDGLTDGQLDKTVERIRKAHEHAHSDNCTIISNDDDWGNGDLMQQQVDSTENMNSNYFTRDVVDEDMFFRVGLPANAFSALNGSGIKQTRRSRFVSMQEVMKIGDVEMAGKIPEPAQGGGLPVSVAELRTFFTALAKEPLMASEAIKPWPESNNADDILLAMVEACRQAKKDLVEELGSVDILPVGEELESYTQVFLAGNFGEVRKYKLKAKTFRREFEVISRHLASEQRPAVKNLFKFGGRFDWVSFITECKKSLPSNIDESLVVEAFMSEIGKQDFNPDEMNVGQLRRLVVNKFKVALSEVPGMPATLGAEDMVLFRKACALTPAGRDYYANVKAKYDELKGLNG